MMTVNIYKEGERCISCGTILSIYNPYEVCFNCLYKNPTFCKKRVPVRSITTSGDYLTRYEFLGRNNRKKGSRRDSSEYSD